MWPSLYNENVSGDARAVLAKAAVVAREAGIEHESLTVMSNRPARSDPAGRRGPRVRPGGDRVHGRRGIRNLVIGSQTQNVLQQASLPVLVLAAESNLPDWEKIEALAVSCVTSTAGSRLSRTALSSWLGGSAGRDSPRGSTCCCTQS